ncbi:cryptochrome/photolyase family protein [Microbispora sp. ATCC PTA-5024]|uniref:cryptochrome/photolyase family protein n=1 Tax=Microbispora sp. ATCC PTA-5024 TaxID=316330 RepID=UPI0003DB818A|nr:cryptochrome/photolyase family protein [Microbispora sp. ATCC PTA-5024]ETK35836.1 deoxyribodipyrimidine photolyase [Microbispora sp. ATCC PTA-5024]
MGDIGNDGGRRWLFADQLGGHFLDAPGQPVLLVEATSVLRRRRFHRQKAHLVLSALRHRAAELGDQAIFAQVRTYREGLALAPGPLTVCRPTSHAAAAFVEGLPGVAVLPPRGFASTEEEFAAWAAGRGRRRLLMEDFYRDARRRLDVLMDGDEPAGGRWNFDRENRRPAPREAGLGLPPSWRPEEDEIDEGVRRDLDRWERAGEMTFAGRDAPRAHPATRDEAVAALRDFVRHRLPFFGPHQDAMLAADPVMAHSMLSPALNLGLLDPMECVRAAEAAHRDGRAPLASVEGYVRQLIGWRDYMWHLYWHFGPDYRRSNALGARTPLPRWFDDLDADAVEARCLSWALAQVRDQGFTHHIVRLMVLGNYALQRGFDPEALAGWFHRSFVDGYDWVMIPNVVGMSQHADGGRLATKPYAAGGAYIDRMSDFCGGCRYRPDRRTGDDACPFTAGYWAFVARNEELLLANPRTARAARGMRRLADIDEVRAREARRGDAPP